MSHKNVIEFFEIGRVKIRKKMWAFGVAKLKNRGERGCCMTPHKAGVAGNIVISTHLSADSRTAQEAIIHETLHALFPMEAERRIREAANVLSKVLTKYEEAKS